MKERCYWLAWLAFVYNPGPGKPLPILDWVLLHQLAIKKIPTDIPPGQLDGGKSSTEIYSFQVAAVCGKVTVVSHKCLFEAREMLSTKELMGDVSTIRGA